MKDTMNREGMTFEEWVCAAGVGVFGSYDDQRVRPYTESWTRYIHEEYLNSRSNVVENPRILMVGGILIREGAKKRETHVYYSKKIREAWKNGEDPSEWRALPKGGQSLGRGTG